jgi:hypothetical protein
MMRFVLKKLNFDTDLLYMLLQSVLRSPPGRKKPREKFIIVIHEWYCSKKLKFVFEEYPASKNNPRKNLSTVYLYYFIYIIKKIILESETFVFI